MSDQKRNRPSLFDDFDGFASQFFRQMSTPEGRKKWTEDFNRDFEETSRRIEEVRGKMGEPLSIPSRLNIDTSFGRKEAVANYRRVQGDGGQTQPSNPVRQKVETGPSNDKLQKELEIQRLRDELRRSSESQEKERKAREETEAKLRQSETEKARMRSDHATRQRERVVEGKVDQSYRLLGLRPGATSQEVKKAHRYLVQAHHPDRFAEMPQHQSTANEKIKEINAAYQILKDHLRF
jgi:DnaJ-domain-containing protein 1